MIRVAISSTSSGTGLVRTIVASLRLGMVLDDPLQGEDARRIEAAGKRLVEQEDRSLGHQGRAEGDLLLLAGGQIADRAVALFGEIEQVEELIDVIHQPLLLDVVEPADGQEKLAGRPLGGQPGLVGEINGHLADRQLLFFRPAAPQAIDQDRAPLGREHAGHHAQQGRLAHAVGPQDHHDLATLDAQADPAEDRPHTIMLRHVEELDHGRLPPGELAASVLEVFIQPGEDLVPPHDAVLGLAIQCPSSGNQT